ncbi:MAG: hypothetical protein HC927_05945 [Deltaproteobacteria bacterium]|nr:hypothetical protein [Deltaproteobacteria bacterium]
MINSSQPNADEGERCCLVTTARLARRIIQLKIIMATLKFAYLPRRFMTRFLLASERFRLVTAAKPASRVAHFKAVSASFKRLRLPRRFMAPVSLCLLPVVKAAKGLLLRGFQRSWKPCSSQDTVTSRRFC